MTDQYIQFKEKNAVLRKRHDFDLLRGIVISCANVHGFCTYRLTKPDGHLLYIVSDIRVAVAKVMREELYLGESSKLRVWHGWKDNSFKLGEFPEGYEEHPEKFEFEAQGYSSNLMADIIKAKPEFFYKNGNIS